MVRKKRSRGFTLIELMVVIALIAIVAVIGIPSYRNVTTTNRMATEMNAFVGDLQFTRSEAIKRGHDVTVCPSTAPTASSPNCNTTNTADWSSGWAVYAPAFGGNATSVLRVQPALQGGDTLVSNIGGSVTFNRNGFSSNAQTVTLNDSASSTSRRRCAVVSLTGRVRLDSGANCP